MPVDPAIKEKKIAILNALVALTPNQRTRFAPSIKLNDIPDSGILKGNHAYLKWRDGSVVFILAQHA